MNQQTTRADALNTSKIPVNKQFVSNLAWDELDSLEKTAAMELIRTLDELREITSSETLLFYLKEFRNGIKDELPGLKQAGI